MKRLFNKMLTNIILVTAFFAPMAVPATVLAICDSNASINSCLDEGTCTGAQCYADADTLVNKNVRLALNLFSWIVGIISVIMIIAAGLKYVTSGGDATKTASSKDTILYALVGLVIVLIAQLIVRFVVNKVTTLTPA